MWDGCLHTVTTTHVTAAHWSGLQINILLYNRSGGVRQNHSLSLSPAEEDEEVPELEGKEEEEEEGLAEEAEEVAEDSEASGATARAQAS